MTVPVGVEAVWALLTPKNRKSGSKITKIAVASVYYSSSQTKKSDFLDHIAQSYNLLCAKYGSDLKFIIAGDLNRLRIGPILNLSPNLRQVVQIPTRTNPDAILDKIITNLHMFFSEPTTLEPLDNDEMNNGKPSDHLTVIWKPLTNNSPIEPKLYKTIKFRPFPDPGIREMAQWVQAQTWQDFYQLSCANAKVDKFETMLMQKINSIFPEKNIRVNKNTKPWMNSQSILLDRQRKREYLKNKKSPKWKKLNSEFEEKSKELKKSYYKNMVEDLKTSNPGEWYSKVKRMSTLDQQKDDCISVEQFKGETSQNQAEIIADQFASISNLYKPLDPDDIEIPDVEESAPHPLYEPLEIYEKIASMKKKASTVPGDVPWRIISEFAVELAFPLSNIYNTSTLSGVWPDLWKFEYVTPVPKVFPPQSTEDLRKISGTKNFSKIYEALISEPIIKDMGPNIRPGNSGSACQRG